MTRMFTIDGMTMKTWNVFKGCLFGCTYCNARRLALTRLKHSPRYYDGFRPRLVTEELDRNFNPGEFVFVAYMGDIAWASFVEIELIVKKIRLFKDTRFLFLTKAPNIYLEWEEAWGFDAPDNLYLGATIETNIDYKLTEAPPPELRYRAMAHLLHPHKFISIEPLMNFHLCTLVNWIKEIRPEIVEIGPDNYGNNLPEPAGLLSGIRSTWKVKMLLETLREIVPTLVEKPGLSRLLDNGPARRSS